MNFISALLLAVGMLFNALSYLFQKTARTIMLAIGFLFSLSAAVIAVVNYFNERESSSFTE